MFFPILMIAKVNQARIQKLTYPVIPGSHRTIHKTPLNNTMTTPKPPKDHPRSIRHYFRTNPEIYSRITRVHSKIPPELTRNHYRSTQRTTWVQLNTFSGIISRPPLDHSEDHLSTTPEPLQNYYGTNLGPLPLKL